MSCACRIAIGRLAERLGDRELIHLLVVALLEVDDLALRGARHQDHREAVGGRVRERGEAIEEARRRNGEAHAGLLGEIAGDCSGVAGVLLVAERQNAETLGLRHAAEIGDRNARHVIDRGQIIELERIDDQVKTVGQLFFLRLWLQFYCCI